jgi:acyl-CoA synthetase (AMP-forming)/AMP-acid ligase II
MWDFSRYKNRIALLNSKNEKIYYQDLILYSKQIAKKIREKTVTLILIDNSLTSAICYISLLNKKRPMLILNQNISNKFLNNIIKKYEPENICIPIKSYLRKNYKNYKSNFKFREFQFLKSKSKDNFKVKHDIGLLVSTSGSTGSVKFIRQTYGNLKSNTLAIIKYLQLKETNMTITTLPLSYTFGMSIINTHLKVGSKILVTKKSLFEKKFWEVFKNNKINTIYGVPFTFEILNKLNFFLKNNSNLKLIAQAGGKISENLQKKIGNYSKKYNKKFFVMYGQAEATTRISYLPYKNVLKKIGSIGVPIDGGRMSLVNNNKIVCKKNSIGEIVYEGKNVCLGYASRKLDINRNDEWNGKIFTGDLAKRDNDGYYFIVGRKKRFKIIYGIYINLDEIENLIKLKFNTSDFSVISKENKIIIYTSTKKLIKKIFIYITKVVDLNINSFEVIFLKKIPKLSNGKNNYKALLNDD